MKGDPSSYLMVWARAIYATSKILSQTANQFLTHVLHGPCLQAECALNSFLLLSHTDLCC